MYHEHPLRILRYSAKNIWLLIFPLIRGIYAATLDVDKLYRWLKGAWFDIAVILVILLFGLLRWQFSTITINDRAIIHKDGVCVKVITSIPFERISSVTAEHSFYLRPFKGMKISCDTSAGIFKSSDMKLVVSRKVYDELIKKMPVKKGTEEMNFQHKANPLSVILFSVFFSSSFSGAVYLAAFFFKGGDIATDIISMSLERITQEMSKLQKFLIVNIPTAAIGIGAILLMTWFISFIFNLLRYSGFCIKGNIGRIEIICGTFTRCRYRITAPHINYTDLRQSLIMKLCRAVTVNISCAGYGAVNKQLPVLFPIRKAKSGEHISGVGEAELFAGRKPDFRPKPTSFWQYIWQPVIAAAAVYPVSLIVTFFFPKLADFADFLLIMAEIPVIWLIIVRLTSLFTSGISIRDGKIAVKYSRGFAFHTVIAEQSRLVKISAIQTPFQRIYHKCNLGFYFNGEQSQRHYVRAIKITDAEIIAEKLNYHIEFKHI